MTDLAVRSSSSIADPNAFLAAQAAKLKQSINVVSPMITCMRNGKLKLPTEVQVESVDVVLLDFVYRNQYYPNPYQEGVYNDPVCQAIGEGSNDELVPMKTSSDIQHPTCAGCPKNQYGSHPSGSKGKACQNQMLIAVTTPEVVEDSDERPEIWLMKVQPTALRALGSYMLNMTNLYGHPIKVVTSLSLDPNRNYPSVLTEFSALNSNWEHHVALIEDAQRALYSGTPIRAESVDASTKLPTTLGE